jgi:hypothetical protein
MIVVPCFHFHDKIDMELYTIDLLINEPIITVEISSPKEVLLSYGMCYRRPNDDWDPVHYSYSAFGKALKRLENYTEYVNKNKKLWYQMFGMLMEDVKNKPYAVIEHTIPEYTLEKFLKLVDGHRS